MSKTLIMMIGLPRSGKTSCALKLGYPIVSPAAISIVLGGNRLIGSSGPMVLGIAKTMVAALFQSGHDQVTLDACNTTRDRRNEWRDDRWSIQSVVLNTPREKCLDRARDSGNIELIPVIESMALRFEPLGEDEGLLETAEVFRSSGELVGIVRRAFELQMAGASR